MASKILAIIPTDNGHTVTVALDTAAIVRIAKDGHNRAIGKLSDQATRDLIAALASTLPENRASA